MNAVMEVVAVNQDDEEKDNDLDRKTSPRGNVSDAREEQRRVHQGAVTSGARAVVWLGQGHGLAVLSPDGDSVWYSETGVIERLSDGKEEPFEGGAASLCKTGERGGPVMAVLDADGTRVVAVGRSDSLTWTSVALPRQVRWWDTRLACCVESGRIAVASRGANRLWIIGTAEGSVIAEFVVQAPSGVALLHGGKVALVVCEGDSVPREYHIDTDGVVCSYSALRGGDAALRTLLGQGCAPHCPLVEVGAAAARCALVVSTGNGRVAIELREAVGGPLRGTFDTSVEIVRQRDLPTEGPGGRLAMVAFAGEDRDMLLYSPGTMRVEDRESGFELVQN